jgi:hypothetical protein
VGWGTQNQWNAARAQLDLEQEAAADARTAAAAYFAAWPKHPPDYFADRSRDLMRRAFDSGDGWACRLLSCLETPAHFSLHTEHLDLSREAAAPALLFDRANVRRWREAIKKHFTGPHRWRLQLGRSGRIHAHIIADLADGPAELPRSGQIVKPCAAYFEAAVRYVCKPPLEYTAEHLALWLEAKKRGRLPRLSGSHGIPTRRRWQNPSSSAFTLLSALSDAPQRTPKTRPLPPLRPTPRNLSRAAAATAAAYRSGQHYQGSSYPISHPERARGPPRARVSWGNSPTG